MSTADDSKKANPGPDAERWLRVVHDAGLLHNVKASHPAQRPPYKNYPVVPGVDPSLFQLPPQGMSDRQREAALAQTKGYESAQRFHFLGYQANQKLDYENLRPYLDFHVNNIGDPFVSGNFTVNAKWMERAVLDYYAALWNARWPSDRKDGESYWGYVLTMGATEGNLYGIYNARDYLAGKVLLTDPKKPKARGRNGGVASASRLVYQQAKAAPNAPNAYTPVAFYSQDTHYSIIKAMRVLAVHTFYEIGTEHFPGQCPLQVHGLSKGEWPQEVPSKGGNAGPGCIDVHALAVLVEFFAARGYPILCIFNYGSTFKGAYDDVEAAGNTLLPILRKYGLDRRRVQYGPGQHDERTGYWFHVDGALGAAYMPFIEMAHQKGLVAERGPNFDFRLPFVHSISMSGHKWIGAPWPTGIYMTRVKMQLTPPDDPEYIGSPDTTFAGSRNGLSAMILWDYLSRHSYEAQMARALYTNDLARYTHEKLLELQTNLRRDLWVERTPLSLTIRFKQANPELVFRYSLSGETLVVGGEQRAYNHVFMMPWVTREQVDAFVEELRQPGAIPEQTPTHPAEPSPKSCGAGDARQLLHVPHTGRGFR
ncbi:pyridoxal-dependent decarboxylase [Sorangium sp. So ce542]|uniref:pyridoxal-dependent decarboxylase n=1 Tax=Sorangium sp. So ce542 TaxID=3133316 RepID=UPI003F645242